MGNYFDFLYRGDASIAMDEGENPKEDLNNLKHTLAEHKEHCVAKPGNCPYEKKLNQAIEKKEEEVEKADDLGESETNGGSSKWDEVAPSGKDEYVAWFASKRPNLVNDILEVAELDDGYSGMVADKVKEIMENPYGLTDGDTYGDIVDGIVYDIKSHMDENSMGEDDAYNELRADIIRDRGY